MQELCHVKKIQECSLTESLRKSGWTRKSLNKFNFLKATRDLYVRSRAANVGKFLEKKNPHCWKLGNNELNRHTFRRSCLFTCVEIFHVHQRA